MAVDSKPSVVVVGSLNVDYHTKVGRLPAPGETIAALDLDVVFGGKGANQALSASRQGASVILVGSVGRDEMGRAYLEHLAGEGIGTRRILETPVAPTGSAFITIDSEGENMIVVASGANLLTGPEHVRAVETEIADSKALLAQFEVQLETVVEAVRIANQAGVTAIVNPSPIRQTFPWTEVSIDVLIVNERESIDLLEFPPQGIQQAFALRPLLTDMNIGTLVVTRGSEPTLVFSPDESFEVPTLPVLPVDTVGAGDAFAGCLAARLSSGESFREAVEAANTAGALTTLGAGAQEPIPNRAQVDQHSGRLAG